MSAYELFQQGLYAWQQELNAGVAPGVPDLGNDTVDVTASIRVDEGSIQSMIWTACSNFLQFVALLAVIWMLLLIPRLYYIALRFRTRIGYVFNYQGPDHETLAARIAELVEDKDRRRLTLRNAKYDSAVLKEQNSRDMESISLLNTRLQEVKQLRRQDKNTILKLDRDLQCATMQMSGLYTELAMTRTQRSTAIKQAEDAENRANHSDYLLKLRTRNVEAVKYKATTAEEDLCSAVAAINISAPASQNSSALAEAERNAAAEKKKMEKDHSAALDALTERSSADATTIANLKDEVETLKANIQERSNAAENTRTEEEHSRTLNATIIANLKDEVKTLKANIQERSDTVPPDNTSELERLTANLASVSSDLEKLKNTQTNTAADLANALSSLQTLTLEKEEAEADLSKANCSLSELKSDQEKTLADLIKASSDLSTMQSQKEKIESDLTKEIRGLHSHVCDHSKCEQQLQEAKNQLQADDLDLDTPQQILIDRLELAQQKICELKAQNESLLEVMRCSRDGADLMDESPDDDAEARIRQELDREFKEERGGLLRRIEDQMQLLKKKDEQLKSNNVSQRLQDELKASKEKTSKLEYDLSILQKATTSKPSTPSNIGVSQTGPSAQGSTSEETIKLRHDLQGALNTAKRLNKETKAAKADYDRVRTILEKKDSKASEEYRNVEKARSELGAEIESLQKKITRLEAGVPLPPPASDTGAPGSGGEESGSAGGKRAREGDEETGGEATKKLKA